MPDHSGRCSSGESRAVREPTRLNMGRDRGPCFFPRTTSRQPACVTPSALFPTRCAPNQCALFNHSRYRCGAASRGPRVANPLNRHEKLNLAQPLLHKRRTRVSLGLIRGGAYEAGDRGNQTRSSWRTCARPRPPWAFGVDRNRSEGLWPPEGTPSCIAALEYNVNFPPKVKIDIAIADDQVG